MYLFITSLLVDIALKSTCVEKCVSFDLTFKCVCRYYQLAV